MAKNEIFKHGDNLSVTVTHPTAPVSGDVVRYGQIVGVATTSEDSVSGKTSVTFRGVHELSVKGVNGSGNSAVAAGDKLYYVDADTPVLSKKDTGVFAGYAWESAGNPGTVASGATAAIPVRLVG
ncbi:capsid cement protein [Actinomadura sp. LOL_016]|uniref:capsid cement protein n=1 Tax=unclassified Actinomadura TaxID=2626254 RepID=UPI003A7FB513